MKINNNNGPRVEVVYDYKHEGDDDRQKAGTVWVRVYIDRCKRRYVSTGVRVMPSEWDDKLWVIRRSDAEVLDRLIQEQVDKCTEMARTALNELRGAVDRGEEKKHVSARLSGKSMRVDRSEASWLDWLKEQIEKSRLGDGTKKHHLATWKALTEFGQMRRFEDVNAQSVMAYIEWCSTKTARVVDADGRVVERPIGQSTVYDHYKRLRKWVGVAVSKRLLPVDVLVGVKVERGRNAEREHLSDEEYERWKSVKLPMACLVDVRDRFLVQMSCGLSYADLMSVDFSQRVEMDGVVTLSGQRVKTGERYFTVILPDGVEVLKRWGWKMLPISNVNYNKYLDVVAKACGIDKHITSHVARHTFACRCLAHGVRIEALQRTLGHRSITTTEIYARMVDKDVVEAFGRMK